MKTARWLLPFLVLGLLAARAGDSSPKTSRNAAQPAELAELTPGEKTFLDELSQGYAYKEIADHLGISLDGVRNYVRNIYKKLHAHSKLEVVNKYLGR